MTDATSGVHRLGFGRTAYRAARPRCRGLAGALEFVAGELRWLHAVLPDLERALA